jgi:hypothetical protein
MDTGKKLKGARLPGPCPFNMTDELASLTNRVKLRSKNISGPGKFSFSYRNTICSWFANEINNLSGSRILFCGTSAAPQSSMIASAGSVKN